jgi:hypothetical protein
MAAKGRRPATASELMADVPPLFTQVDISAGPAAAGLRPIPAGDPGDTNRLLHEMVGLQRRTCDLLVDLIGQVSLQQRQRAAELKAWKESNPELAASCRRAAESLSKVHTEFLASIAEEAAENAENFTDSEYALGEFIDRFGPRLAHFNGVLQLFAQLGAPLPQPETPAEG